MRRLSCPATLFLSAFCLVGMSLTSCSPSPKIPRAICQTPISRKLSAAILQPTDGIRERTSSGFGKPGQWSYCKVYVGEEQAMEIKLATHGGSMDPMKAAYPGDAVFRLQNPRRIRLADDAVVGDDGAIATTRCLDSSGADHFTLTLKVTRGRADAQRRVVIERFMRAYMPATVKSLHCLRK
ncbi:hypothetical protein [Streptomyces sp. NPDC008150]|uniref:hypothetical protein n=1 Tax=Streptomyces sp. NPDC008150 TaxID=3364816 RepID=UPI0036EF2E7A